MQAKQNQLAKDILFRTIDRNQAQQQAAQPQVQPAPPLPQRDRPVTPIPPRDEPAALPAVTQELGGGVLEEEEVAAPIEESTRQKKEVSQKVLAEQKAVSDLEEQKPLTRAEILSKWDEIIKKIAGKPGKKIISFFHSGYLFVNPINSSSNPRSSTSIGDLYNLEKYEDLKGVRQGARHLKGENIIEFSDFLLPEGSITFKNHPAIFQKLARAIVGQYKIHLMPQDSEMMPVFKKIIDMMQNDPEFNRLTHTVKFYPSYNETDEQVKESKQRETIKGSNQFVMPRVVIYPPNGKENAQKLLNYLYGKLKEFKGLGIKPRFNDKTTDLIYVAQGDADDKKNSDYDQYYEPGKLYYLSDYFSKYGDFGEMRLQSPK